MVVARVEKMRVAIGDAGMGRGIVGVDVEGALEHLLGQPEIALGVAAMEEPAPIR